MVSVGGYMAEHARLHEFRVQKFRAQAAAPMAPVVSHSSPRVDADRLSSRDLLSLQRIVGNQAIAQALGQRSAPDRTPSEAARAGSHVTGRSVQRLIIVGDPDPSPGRMVAVHNLQLRFPGQKIVSLADADLGDLGSGEMLFISAHGSPDSVGGLSPQALAAELLARGLKTGTSIDLKSCSTAVPSDSYVAKLEAEIRNLSNDTVIVLIQGYTSTHVITEEGGSMAKDPAVNVGALKQEYNDIFASHKSEWDQATKYIKKATAQNVPLEEIARNVAIMTRAVFQELYAHNPKVAKPDTEARGTSSWRALYAHLDEFIAASLRSMDPLWGDELVLKLIRAREHARWSTTTASYIA